VGSVLQDVGYPGSNPPFLSAGRTRAPYRHDGPAYTLGDVLTSWDQPSKLTGKPDCTPAELSDLIAYLETL